MAHLEDDRDRLAGPPAFDKEKYKGRNVIERLNEWLKELRRIATRYEKPAVDLGAMIRVAFFLWLDVTQ